MNEHQANSLVRAIDELIEAKVAVILHESGVYQYPRVGGGLNLGISRVGKFDRLDETKNDLRRALRTALKN